jgi:LacI family transcriptional regulator
LAELGFEILLSEITKTEAENNERPRFVSRGKADAIVVLGRAPQNIVESLAECGLPMLILDSYSKNIDSIYTDGEKATATLTEHLLEKGHKKIAYFACDNLDFNTDMRIKGFLNTMKNAKLEKNAILVRNFETIEESNVHFDKLMASKNRPTAILAANDDLATNLMFHAQAKGMRVPQDIAFAGFDDINLAVRCMPQLTTVHVDCAKIGEIGADTIVERIKNPNLHTRTQIFNVDMVARSSTK